MKDRSKKRNIIFTNNSGSTMVETVVAFVVLMIVLALIYKIVAFCSVLRMRAHDTDVITREFTAEMNNKNNHENEINLNSHITIEHIKTSVDEDGKQVPLFYLVVDEEKTDSRNIETSMPEDSDFETLSSIENIRKNISLYNINVITYRYTPDEEMDQEHMIIPKALSFLHKGDDTP